MFQQSGVDCSGDEEEWSIDYSFKTCGDKGEERITVAAGEKFNRSVRLFVHFMDMETGTTWQLRKRISGR